MKKSSPPLRAVLLLAMVLLAVLLEAALVAWTVLAHDDVSRLALWGTMGAWLVFAMALAALRKLPTGSVTAVVLGGSLLLGVAAIAAPPATSNDSARYAWDGIVQKAGVSPYADAPANESLARLRPDWLFAAPSSPGQCAKDQFVTGTESAKQADGSTICTAINRPTVHTIYPAVAELYFLGVRLLLPSGAGYLAFQVTSLLLSLAMTWGLLRHLRRSNGKLWLAAVWGWSPVVIFEAINNAHVDVLAAGLMLVAVLALHRGRVVTSGVAFGAAVATKLIPAIAAPALLFRKPVRFVLAAVLTFALTYIPYVLSSGAAVIGFLPGYLSEEGYDAKSTSRFALLRLILPPAAVLPVGIVLLVILALYVVFRVDRERPWNTQLLMVGGTLLIVSPSYPWYTLLLVPFVVLSGRLEYLAVSVAITLIYLTVTETFSIPVTRLALAAAVLMIVGVGVTRMYNQRRQQYAKRSVVA